MLSHADGGGEGCDDSGIARSRMGWRAEISKGRGNGRGLADKQSGRLGGKKKSASNKFTRTASSSNTEFLTDSEVVALITLPGLRADVTDELFREVTRSVPFLHGKEMGFVELVAPQMEFVRLEKDELVIQEGESGKEWVKGEWDLL